MVYKTASRFKPLLVKLLPKNVQRTAKDKILKSITPAIKQQGLVLKNNTKGINLIGYARAEMGIGESCRLAANSLDHTDIPFGIINFNGTNNSRKSDMSWVHKEIEGPLFDINLFHINAEQMPELFVLYGESLFLNRYNIGFWHWELPDFPDDWQESFKYVDEIWVPSTFVADSIAMKSPVPVVKIPHSIEVRILQPRNRTYYNLPEASFLFLTMFDLNSVQERKNPRGSIEAFKQAFSPNDNSVGLVIKINGTKDKLNENMYLRDFIEDYKNVYIIDGTVSRNDINALIQVVDCFVSLHRSEGFGLGFAEAMYLGKPVIGTNWSSNIDFMKHTSSCLVDYELVAVGKDYGPYKANQQWAEPKVANASEYMIKLVSDSSYYDSIALAGQKYIQEQYSPKVIGELIEKRLDYIYKWKFGG